MVLCGSKIWFFGSFRLVIGLYVRVGLVGGFSLVFFKGRLFVFSFVCVV